MTRAIKFVLAAVGLFVLLLLLLGLYFRFFFDPNDFRQKLGDVVETQTGRSLTIEGDIDLHYFPWVGMTIGRTRLGEDAAFGDGDFVSFDSASVRVKLMPLLKKELEVGKLTLDGLTVNAIRNAQGVDNWSTLLSESDSAAQAPATDAGAPASPFSTSSIGGLELTNANISFDDRQAGTTMRLTNMDASTGAIGSGSQEIAVQAGFDLSVSEPALAVRVDLSGDGRNEDGTLRFANPVLRVSGDQQKLSQDLAVDEFLLEVTAPAMAASEAAINMPSPTVQLSAKGGSLDDLNLEFRADSLAMDIEGDKLELPKPAVTLAVSGDIVPAPVDLDLTADALTVAPTAETMTLSNYVLDAMGVSARGSLNASKWSSNLRASGPLDVPTFSARELMSRLDIPVETADSSALSKVSLKGAIDMRG
ncbi:MAG: AsmA family protein, partial [Pseudomonadota bacterium]